jgi:hypothetical protein
MGRVFDPSVFYKAVFFRSLGMTVTRIVERREGERHEIVRTAEK